MAIENAIQTLWSAEIQTQLETLTSLKDHSDFTFEGEIKRGAKLKIVGVTRPTIRTYVPGTALTREAATDTGMFLEINQYKYFDFEVDDVEAAQSVPGLIQELSKEATRGLAEEADKYVATVIDNEKADISQVKLDVSAATDGGLSVLESAFAKLYKNNCRPNDKYWLEITPDWYTVLRPAILEVDTNNSEMIKSGAVGRYGNAWITIENNLKTNVTLDSQAGCVANILRTSKAVAFAGQINEVEAYRPQDAFSDAVKGLYTFGAKVVRPKEICLIGTY